MISDMVADAANKDMQHDLFVILADHLALGMGTRPGPVMVLDMEALADQSIMLEAVLAVCSPSAN